MKNYRILNLPKYPLINKEYKFEKSAEELKLPINYTIKSLDILKPEIIESFLNIELIPEFVVIFDCQKVSSKRLIHSDISYNSEINDWSNLSFGVNWDLTGTGTFQWWNIPETVKRVYPSKEIVKFNSLKCLAGIHYGHQFRLGTDHNYTLIEEQSTAYPMLVRTDIPHSVEYNIPRTCLSLRFKNSLNINWSEIYFKLNSLALD